MLDLVYKDIRTQKGILTVVLLQCITGNLIFINTPAFIYIVIPPIIVYLYIENLCTYNYKYKADIMFNSLPVTKKSIVISKYVDSIIYLFIGILLTYIVTILFKGFKVSGFSGINKLMGLDMINKLLDYKSILITCIINTTILICIYYPIYFKFEYTKVKITFAFVSFLLCIVPIILVKALGNTNAYKLYTYFRSLPFYVLIVSILLILFLAVFISIKMSVKNFNNRDL